MTFRGGIRGLGLGIVTRFTGDARRSGAPFPADILAAALELWHFSAGTTPSTVGSDISAWVGRKGLYTLSQATGARQPTLRADGVEFVLADTNFMTSVQAGLANAIVDVTPWTVAAQGTWEDSGAAVSGIGGWVDGGMRAHMRRTNADKLNVLRLAGTSASHVTTASMASPESAVWIGQGAGGTLDSGLLGSYTNNSDNAPADVSGVILATQSTTFLIGDANNPFGGKIRWLLALTAVLTADQRTRLQAWADAGAVYP